MRVMHRPDRVVLRVFGRDPVKMIQGLASNDIAGAAVDASVYTGFLTPKGKLVGVARVLRRNSGDVWIEADVSAADNIAANLKKYVPPLFAKFEFTDFAVVGFIGADVAASKTDEAEAVLRNPFRADAVDVVVRRQNLQDFLRAAVRQGATPLDSAEWEVRRIEAAEPKWGAELTEAVIPLEAGLRQVAISETKGCYTGQEVIVRILHRGHVNRQLRHIFFQTADVPSVGAEINANGKVVGQITSACYSPGGGHAVALGYVRREISPPADVTVAGQTAQLKELPWAQ